MAKKIGILSEHMYEELELWYPMLRFREEGFETVAIGPEKGTVYKSKNGYPCTSDISIEEAKVDDFAGLVCPGGFSPDRLRRNKKIVDFVRDMVNAGKPVGAICHGPWMLCSAKVLKGKRVTSFFAIRDDVENAGGIYEDKEVVVDGNIITSRVPTDLPAFSKAMLAQLR